MALPLVSVVLPTYNRARMLGEALASVYAQTCQAFEILVVDDGSTDSTPEVVKGFDTRLRYIPVKRGGVARARNRGMAAATGEYICYLDSDDQYYPYKLELQLAHMRANPDTVMTYSNFSAFDGHGYLDEFHLRTYHRSAYRHMDANYGELFEQRGPLTNYGCFVELCKSRPDWSALREFRGHIYDAYFRSTIVFTNSMMFRRALLKDVAPQDPYFGHFHDLEFALRLCAQGLVAFQDVPTYRLRYHPGQVSTRRSGDGDLNAAKLQRGLLRVARAHGPEVPEYYARNKVAVDATMVNRLRAAAIPLLAYGGPSRHRRRCFHKRARVYLHRCERYGAPQRLLLLVSMLPELCRRMYFAITARLQPTTSQQGTS